jgi:hypothetical protein
VKEMNDHILPASLKIVPLIDRSALLQLSYVPLAVNRSLACRVLVG